MDGLQATVWRQLSGADLEPLGLKEVFFEGPDTRAGDGVSHLSLHLEPMLQKKAASKAQLRLNSDTYSSLHVPI